MTFSNTVIDMKDLMRYHYPKCRNDSLAHMAMDLHIPFTLDNPETRCRLIRRFYEKTDRAAGRKTGSEVPADSQLETDAACRRVIDVPLRQDTRDLLLEDDILMLGDLRRFSKRELQYRFDADSEVLSDILSALDRYHIQLRRGHAGRGLHGYPDNMKELADRRPPGWEILLFSRAYAAGYEQLACWRTAKRARASYENLTHFIYSFQEMTAFVSSKSDDLIAILQDAEHVLDVEIPAVLSGEEEDTTGDPADSLICLAENILLQYRKMLVWQQEFSYINTGDDFREAFDALLEVGENACNAFESLYRQLEECRKAILVDLENPEGRGLDLNIHVTFQADTDRLRTVMKKLRQEEEE